MVEIVVANKVLIVITAGSADPAAARRAMTADGIRVILDVLRAKRVHIAGEAVVLSILCFCSSFTAFIPRGVEEFPSPRMLALRFKIIAPKAGLSFGISGKIYFIRGDIKPLSELIRPDFFAIFKRPSQIAIGPSRFKLS